MRHESSSTAQPLEAVKSTQQMQTEHSLDSQIQSPTRKRAPGHAGKLGFGSSSHSRIEGKAQHASGPGHSRDGHSEQHAAMVSHSRLEDSPKHAHPSGHHNSPHRHSIQHVADDKQANADSMQLVQQNSPAQRYQTSQQPSLHADSSYSQGVSDMPDSDAAVQHRQSPPDTAGQATQAEDASDDDQSPTDVSTLAGDMHGYASRYGDMRKSSAQAAGLSELGCTVSLPDAAHSNATPSFMRPTVSSLVHTASRQRSLRKSQSEIIV